MNGVHDMGGMQGFGPVVAEADEPVFHAPWEGRVHALTGAGFRFGGWNIDAWRHALERVPPADYLRISYYERWLEGFTELLVGARLVSREELARRRAGGVARPLAAVTEAPAARSETPFAVGQQVRAKTLNPGGHTRLPRYVRGRLGKITAQHRDQVFADANASGHGAHRQPVYQVRFEARELWGEAADPNSAVYLDLWEAYLEPA